jgi:cytochrome c-type biogenesis protein CcmH/NrfF
MPRPDPAGARRGRPGPAALPLLLAAAVLLTLGSSPAPAQQGTSEEQQRAMESTSHPPPAAGGVPEKSEAVMKVTTRVLCMCGGCVNQTLHECTCGMAAQEREAIAAKIAAGKTPEEITKAYVDEFGKQILATPEMKGYNVVGWLVPFIVAIVLLAVLTFVLRGWVKPGMLQPLPASTGSQGAGTDPIERSYREKLERELKEFEG